jgi:hypothetical protein
MLLDKLKNLQNSIPPLEGKGDYGSEQFTWLAEASTLIASWNIEEGQKFDLAVRSLVSAINRKGNYALIVIAIQRAITSLQNLLPDTKEHVFRSGETYDFFKALKGIVKSARSKLLVIDPYMDAETFDGYLNSLSPGVEVRLLANRYESDLKVAAERFRTQYQCKLEVRKSNLLHDRFIFVDRNQCWALTASIKDAAKKSPTCLLPLSSVIAAENLDQYESIWVKSEAI